MIRTIIVEDVDKDRELLVFLLQKNHPEINIIGSAKGVDSAYKLILDLKPDLVFFDIEIEERGTSFDIIEKFLSLGMPIPFAVVFVTAYKEHEYTTKAFDYAAVDYITKPIDRTALQRAVLRSKEEIQNKDASTTLKRLINILKNENETTPYLTVHLANSQYRIVQIDDIIYVKAEGALSKFHLRGNEVITAFRNLGKYRTLLELDHNFFSVSHNTTLNLDYLDFYNHKSKQIFLKGGIQINASRIYGSKLLDHLKSNHISVKVPLVNKIKDFLKMR
jgi:two-component system LytT family response regulator